MIHKLTDDDIRDLVDLVSDLPRLRKEGLEYDLEKTIGMMMGVVCGIRGQEELIIDEFGASRGGWWVKFE